MSADRRKQHKSRLKDFNVTDFLPSQESGMESAVVALLARDTGIDSEAQDKNRRDKFAPVGTRGVGILHTGPTDVGVEPVGYKPIGELSCKTKVNFDDEGAVVSDQNLVNDDLLDFRFTKPSTNKSEIDLAPIGLKPTGVVPVGLTSESKEVCSQESPLVAGDVALSDVLAQIGSQATQSRSRGKLMRAARVEDGHSATQDTLYWHLWRHGQHVKGSRSKFIQAGYGQIQATLKIDRSNVQDAIRELQKKMSIRIVQSSTVGTATVYEIFCCDDILAKRREQGMLWVHRFGTRRADFVSPDSNDNQQVAPIGTKPIGAQSSGRKPIAVMPSRGESLIDSTGITPIQAIGDKPIQQAITAKDSNTSCITRVLEILHEELGEGDYAAATRIVAGSRQSMPSVTDDEIVYQLRLQARRLRRNRKVDNPLGVLITHMPKCFEGEVLGQFRNKKKRNVESDTDHLLTDQKQQEYQAILNNPAASESEKKLARNLLEQKSVPVQQHSAD